MKRLADLLEHRIIAASALDRGSTFVLELPSANIDVIGETPVETVRQQQESGVTVLFIDDDMAIVDSLSMFFAMAHVEARSAENGNEPLARLQEGFRPNVLISDYRLPNENGVMVVERVRGALGFDIPSIVMSGDTSLRHIEAQNISNLVVVQKPVDPDALIDLIYERAKSATSKAT